MWDKLFSQNNLVSLSDLGKIILSIFNLNENLPSVFLSLLQEFQDVLSDPPNGLPPERGIEHQIDLILGSSLPKPSILSV